MASQQGKFHIPRRVSSASASPSVSSSSYRGSLSATPTPTTTTPHHQQHPHQQQHEYHQYHDHHPNSYYVTDGRRTDARPQPPRTDDRIPLSIQSNTAAATATTPEEKIILSTIAETSPPNGNSPMTGPRMHDARSGAAGAGGDCHFQPELRERASSPLLGQSDRRNRLRRAPAAGHLHPQHYTYTKNPLRASESTSALHNTSSSASSSSSSYYDDPLRLPPTSPSSSPQEPMTTAAPGHPDLSSRARAPLTSHSATDLKSTARRDDMASPHQWARQNTSTKSKLRPMMDLSRLFPKPRDESPRLLSPTRMMASPSPVSMLSEESSSRTHRFHAPRNKLSRNRGMDSISVHREQLQEHRAEERMQPGWTDQSQQRQHPSQTQYQQDYAQHGPYERRKVPKPFREEDSNTWKRKPGFSNWFDGPLGHVSDDEDSGIDIDSESQVRESWPAEDLYASRSVYSNANGHSSSVSDRTSALSGSSGRTLRPSPSQSGRAGSANTRPSSTIRTPSTVTERERPLRSHPPEAAKSPASSQSQEAPFGSSNLNEFSVLCLSSDDEEEEEEAAADNDMSNSENRTFMRDSVASFDDGEVCTAKAAVATTRKPSIRSVKANTASQSKSPGRPSPPSLEFQLARQSSKRGQAPSDRRSRFLAVTRQEEYLLEALRRNKGALPATFFNDNDSISGSDVDGNASSASRKSIVDNNNAEASFLRLSVAGPPTRGAPRPHARTSEEQQTGPRRGGGGVEPDYGDHNTEQSTSSPRISLIHSDAMPSPSTALTSPRTPTSMSAAQRFSLQSPHPPPNYSPPPVPDQNRHSRTRTDSSGALAPNGNKEEKEKELESGQDLPIWALGWNQELGGEIAVAH